MLLTALITLVVPATWAEDVKTGPLQLNAVTYDQAMVKSAPGSVGKSEANAEGGGLKRIGAGPAELTKITLTGNKALMESAEAVGLSASGGGAYLAGFDSLSLVEGRVAGNLASARNGAFAHGGGLALAKVGRVVLSGFDFIGNVVTVVGTGQSSAIAAHEPSSGARGGALSLCNQGRAEPVFVPADLMKVSLTDSMFNFNRVEADGTGTLAAGGALALMGHIEAEIDGSGLKLPMFSKNKAVAGPGSNGGAEGGAVIITGNPFRELAGDLPPTTIFTKVVFEGNMAESQVQDNESMDARGGAVSLQALEGKVFFRDCVFNANQLKTAVVESSKGRGRARGGAIFSEAGLVIENSVFKNNSGFSPGSALGGALEVGGSRNVIKNSSFEYNTARGGLTTLSDKYKGLVAGCGGALYLSGRMTIVDSTFTNNFAAGLTAQGGAIFVGRRGQLTLLDTSISDNSAIGASEAAGGKLVIGVSDKKTMTISGNKAGPDLDRTPASGIFLSAPYSDEPAPPPPADGRPPRPETDDLIVKTGEEAKLMMRDPIQGEKAKVSKEGPGLLAVAGTNRAAAWKIQSGTLGLLADEQGRGAILQAGEELNFAENTVLSLEPGTEQSHVIEAAGLKLSPGFQIVVAGEGSALEQAVILKISGEADLQSLSGQSYSGTLTAGQAVYDYSLVWNDQGELIFSPTQKP